MKYFILLGLLLSSITKLVSQNIPNGGFEEVFIDSVYPLQSHPVNWLSYYLYFPVTDVCFPELPQGELTNESYSGNWAIKMETFVCTTGIGAIKIRTGGFLTGNLGMWPPKSWSLNFHERPEYLNFFYKFHQENEDSAHIKLLLFNYDSITPGIPTIDRIDTVAYSEGIINEKQSEYIQYSLPINYLSDSIPNFIKIDFSSGYKCHISTCTPGTILWVDDVSVSGGTVSHDIVENENEEFFIYPNPTSDIFYLKADLNPHLKSLKVYDLKGTLIKSWDKYHRQYSISDLIPGVYFVKIEREGMLITHKLYIF